MNKLKEICIAQAKSLLLEFGEFYPFAFATDTNNRIIPISAYFGEEEPTILKTLEYLENAFVVSDKEHNFSAVALCVNVFSTTPYSDKKMDCIEIRIDQKGVGSLNIYVPYRIEDKNINFHLAFEAQGTLEYFYK